MPIHEFVCKECNHSEDSLVSMNTKKIKCTKCGGAADKVMSAPFFILKGLSWAKDNYGLKKIKEKKR